MDDFCKELANYSEMDADERLEYFQDMLDQLADEWGYYSPPVEFSDDLEEVPARYDSDEQKIYLNSNIYDPDYVPESGDDALGFGELTDDEIQQLPIHELLHALEEQAGYTEGDTSLVGGTDLDHETYASQGAASVYMDLEEQCQSIDGGYTPVVDIPDIPWYCEDDDHDLLEFNK